METLTDPAAKTRPSLGRRALAALVVVLVTVIVLKLVIGFVIGIVWLVVAVVAIGALLWALNTLL